MGFLAAGTYICSSFRPTIPLGSGRCHSGSSWSKAPSSCLPLTLSSVLCAAALGPEVSAGGSVRLQRMWGMCGDRVVPPCAGSPDPSLPLTLCNGQVHCSIYWGNPMGHSRLPKSNILPLLFAQSLYSTSVFSLPGSKVAPLCPSLLWPSVLSSSFQRWGEQGTVMGSDFLGARGTWCWRWASGPCFCCPLAALSPLAVAVGQCFPTQGFPRLPCPCGTKSCGLVSSMNWGNETQGKHWGGEGCCADLPCTLQLALP